MEKTYIVRVSGEERKILSDVIRTLSGTSQMIRQRFVERGFVERGFVERGFELTVNGKVRDQPVRPKCLDGKQEAQIIATRLAAPPKGYASWALRLMAPKLVELEITDSVSNETVTRTLKKRHDNPQHSILDHSSGMRCGIRGQHGRSAGNIRKTLRSEESRVVHG